MKLFLCTRLDGSGWGYTAAMVVRAESYGAAKRMVRDLARGSGRDAQWKVARIREEGTPGRILEDYIAG